MTIFPHLQSIPVGIFVPNCCTIALHACCSSTKIGTWANSTFHCWKFDQLSTPITFIFTLSQKEKCKKMLHIFKKQWWKSSHLQSFGFQTHTHTHTWSRGNRNTQEHKGKLAHVQLFVSFKKTSIHDDAMTKLWGFQTP